MRSIAESGLSCFLDAHPKCAFCVGFHEHFHVLLGDCLGIAVIAGEGVERNFVHAPIAETFQLYLTHSPGFG